MASYKSPALNVILVNRAGLNGLATSQLVVLYNEITGKSIKKFENRGTAEKRTGEVLEARIEELATSEKEKKAATKQKSTPTTGDSVPARRGRGLCFDYPLADEVRPPRFGTARARAAHLLGRKNGATLEEVMREVEWSRGQAVPGIRLLHKECGYGLRQEGERIYLVQPAAEVAS